MNGVFSSGRHRVVALTVLTASLGVTLATQARGTSVEDAAGLLRDARERIATPSFSGTVVVEWRDAEGVQRNEVAVRSADGTVEVLSDRSFVRTVDGGLRRDDSGWVEMGSTELLDVVPTPSDKYDLTLQSGPAIAGRPTTAIDAVLRDGGGLVERVFIDTETGIMLRRERFAADGSTVLRSVSFVELAIGEVSLEVPDFEASSARPTRRLEGIYRDPDHAGDGFVLVSRSLHGDGTAQLLYGDGLLTVSVFEEPGALDWSALPDGGVATRVDGVPARRFELAVGFAYVWERGGVVYTAVSDAPEGQILGVAEAVSAERVDGRVARLARTMLSPFEL